MGQYILKVEDKWGNVAFVECENDDEMGRAIGRYMVNKDDQDVVMSMYVRGVRNEV